MDFFLLYSVFHQFRQAKFAYFRLKPFSATDPDASKNDARYKSVQNWLKNNHLATLI